jgi:radical SAM protein with 4Fe4S-binding SPASM domain
MLKTRNRIAVADPVTKVIARFSRESFESFLNLDGLRLSDSASFKGASGRFVETIKNLGLIEETSRTETAYNVKQIKAQIDRCREETSSILNPPFRPTLNVNEKCKCACIHCYNNTNQNTFPEMDKATIVRNVLSPLAHTGCSNIMWSGGDPVLSADKTIYLTRKASRLGMTVTTQATEFSEKFLRSFAEAGGKGIQISLFSSPSHPEIDEELRGRPGIWNISVKNILKAKDCGLAVFINMILFPESMDELEKTANFVHDLGVDTFRSSIPVIQGRAIQNKQRLTFRREEINELVDRALRLKAEYKNEMNVLVDISERSPKRSHYALCSAGITYLHVAGYNVYPCNFMMEDRFCAGSVLDETIDHIWRCSSVWQEFRALKPINKVCVECENRKSHYPVCTDCRAVMYKRYGSFFSRDGIPCKSVEDDKNL